MSIEQRFARLERQNVQLKAAGLIGFALLVLSFGVGAIQESRPYVDAQGFRLVDDKGKNWGGIALTADGPMMLLKDERGNERLKLYLAKDGYAKLYMLDSDGKSRLRIADNAESIGLAINDEKGNDRLVLGSSKEGESFHLGQEERGFFKLDTDATSASMFLMNPKEENRIAIASTDDTAAIQISKERMLLAVSGGIASFSITDSKKKAGFSFFVNEDSPVFALNDTNGKKRVTIGLAEGNAGIHVLDEGENPRLLLGSIKRAAAITLANERGQATWTEKN